MKLMVWYELKKYVLTKRNILLLIILTLIMTGVLVRSEIVYIFARAESRIFYEQIGQTFSGETRQKLAAEREKLEEKLFDVSADGIKTVRQEETLKKGKYGIAQIREYGYLRDALDCIEAVETRNRNTEILSEQMGNPAYEAEKNNVIADRSMLTAAAQHMPVGVFVCIACIFFMGSSFPTEYERRLYPVVCISPYGYGGVCTAKILTGVLVAAVCNLYFWGWYLVLQNCLVGMPLRNWALPLFLAEGFEMCPSGAAMSDLLAGQFVSSIFGSVLTVIIVLAMSRLIKRSLYTMTAAFVLFGIVLLPDMMYPMVYHNYAAEMKSWYILPEPEFYKMIGLEKLLNPLSALQFQYYMEKPRYMRILGYQYPAYCGPLMMALALIGIVGVCLFWEKKKGL